MRINKIVLDVVAVCAVLLLIGLLVVIYNKQKVGKSDNPAAQKAALTLLAGIPVHWAASKSGYSREQFGKPWTDEVRPAMLSAIWLGTGLANRGCAGQAPA